MPIPRSAFRFLAAPVKTGTPGIDIVTVVVILGLVAVVPGPDPVSLADAGRVSVGIDTEAEGAVLIKEMVSLVVMAVKGGKTSVGAGSTGKSSVGRGDKGPAGVMTLDESKLRV